ncbi:MAG: transposase [Armatimonadota bacterium]
MQPEKKYKRREARDIPGHSHMLTFSTRKRSPHLLNEQICLWLAGAISKAGTTQGFTVLAYVFMPDHVHLLIRPSRETYKIADILKSIKQGVSRRALIAGLIQDVLWEPGGGHDRNIFTEEARANAINYIHFNPVRKGLCSDIMEYRWSSARSILLDEAGEIEVDRSW